MTTPYDIVFGAVKLALDKSDPEGLLRGGAPDDEYDVESKAIAENIMGEIGLPIERTFKCEHLPTETEIWMIVCVILHLYFHSITAPILYWAGHRQLARDIWLGLKERIPA